MKRDPLETPESWGGAGLFMLGHALSFYRDYLGINPTIVIDGKLRPKWTGAVPACYVGNPQQLQAGDSHAETAYVNFRHAAHLALEAARMP